VATSQGAPLTSQMRPLGQPPPRAASSIRQPLGARSLQHSSRMQQARQSAARARLQAAACAAPCALHGSWGQRCCGPARAPPPCPHMCSGMSPRRCTVPLPNLLLIVFRACSSAAALLAAAADIDADWLSMRASVAWVPEHARGCMASDTPRSSNMAMSAFKTADPAVPWRWRERKYVMRSGDRAPRRYWSTV
jgi:hypothetical protein